MRLALHIHSSFFMQLTQMATSRSLTGGRFNGHLPSANPKHPHLHAGQ
jgi:hypothetical protein